MGQHVVCFVSNLGAPNFDGLSSCVPSKTAAILRVCRYKYDYYYYIVCVIIIIVIIIIVMIIIAKLMKIIIIIASIIILYRPHVQKITIKHVFWVTVSPGAPTVLPDAVSTQSQECKALAARGWGKWEDCGATYIHNIVYIIYDYIYNKLYDYKYYMCTYIYIYIYVYIYIYTYMYIYIYRV